MNKLLLTALYYREMGIATIPIQWRFKKPCIPEWEQYMNELPSELDLRCWFAFRLNNIAVISGWANLTIIDFDDLSKFEQWRSWCSQVGSLAQYVRDRTRIVYTARGAHVYVFTEEKTENAKYEGIDILAQRKYALIPPSIHPSGAQYRYRRESEIIRIDNIDEILPDFLRIEKKATSSHTEHQNQPNPRAVPQGNYWVEDQTNYIVPLLHKTLYNEYEKAVNLAYRSAASNQADKELGEQLLKRKNQIGQYTKLTSVQKLASSRPKIAFDGNNWDMRPWLLAVENGVIDLKTGKINPGRPEQYIRSYAPVEWRGINEPCPRWELFQQEIIGFDDDIAKFKQRLFGYSIVGEVIEHILPILHGEEGRNGKSTEVETIMAVLGDKLSGANSADMLMNAQKSSEGAKPFTVGLQGKRFFCARESNEGDRIDAGYVKEITGGDMIQARSLNAAPISFLPSHTPFLMTNQKPHISADDSAVWERIILIPYEQRFLTDPDPNKFNEFVADKNLKNMLKKEKSGILAWLVRGCLEWQEKGLDIPDSLKQESKKYRDEEDMIAQFIIDRCDLDQSYSSTAMELYQSYRDWAYQNGERNPMTNTAFGRKMTKKFSKKRMIRGFIYQGIKVNPFISATIP